uniref:Putative nucleolar pre-rrna processing protein n=1 Tax=Ixodes ricinus TaxID=34613 RepID=V5HML7_IXORI
MKGRQKIDDDRFKHIATDPRFRGVPKSQRKVKIDDRFAGMFDDKRFKLKYVMDKRGRPIHRTTSEDLKKYYAVSSSDSENDDDEEADDRSDQLADGSAEAVADELPEPSKSGQKQTKAKRNLDVKLRGPSTDDVGDETDDDDDSAVESDEESEQSSDDAAEEQERDPSRGVGNIETSSDEDDSGDESGEDSEPDVGWGELDRDAPKGDDVTRRLALCNLDWDKLKAQDLFVLLHSFLPPGGAVKGVTIYPSAFGKERMAQESVSGPSGLVESAPKKAGTGRGDQTNGGERFDREALRKYQLDRLRYFYAVAECDSPETADHLYRELDGREYETSGTCLDLRFVPDDMTFDDEPSSVADSLPDPSTYTPISFVTSALQSVNVELTWDEGNPRRSQAIQRAFQGDGDVVGDDLRVYLASSSSEDEEETEEAGDTQAGGRKKQTAEAQIQKYRDLLKSLDGDPKEEEKADDVEMEVTWNPDLHKQVEDMVKKKLEQPEGQTPFAEFLQKRKEKHKMKKALNKKADAGENGEQAASGADDNDDVQQAFSDDDIPSDVDVNDDFFKEELENRKADKGGGAKKAKQNKAKPGKKQAPVGDSEAEKSKQAELELLLMDDEDDGSAALQPPEADSTRTRAPSGRRRRAARRGTRQSPLRRPPSRWTLRILGFRRCTNSHHFSIDPTDRHFKKTKGMDALLTEKQKRRLAEPSAKPTEAKKPKVEEAGKLQPETKARDKVEASKSLASLASSIKFKVGREK